MTNSYYGNSIGDGTGNDDQRLSEIKNMSGTNQLSKFDYTYSPVGTIATWTQQTNSTSAAVTNTISYDNADQLTQAAQSGGATNSYGYYYDPAGNRLSEKVNSTTTAAGRFNTVNELTTRLTSPGGTTVSGHTSGAITNATVNAIPATISNGTNFSTSVTMPGGTNVFSVVATPGSAGTPIATQRYQVVTSGGTSTTLTYDSNGNVLTDENGYHYTWDALNRLIRITYANTAYTTFAYDGLSRRTQIAEYNSSHTLTSTKNYVWIGSEIAEERNASNTVTKRFFPQGEQQSGTSYYYTRDHLGGVRELLNSSGTIVGRYSYDPYGRTTLVSGSNLATKQYAGMYMHQASGLYLTRAGRKPSIGRPYDAVTGRWLSRDTFREKGGINLYGYVGDDPINDADKWGLSPTSTSTSKTDPGGDAMQSAMDLEKKHMKHGHGDWGGGYAHCVANCLLKRRYGSLTDWAIRNTWDCLFEHPHKPFFDYSDPTSPSDIQANEDGAKAANGPGSCEQNCLNMFPNMDNLLAN